MPARLTASGDRLRLWIWDGGYDYPLYVDPLLTSPSWTAESDQISAYLGASVGTAGDVNGDGYDDLIVGAPYYDVGRTNEGRIFVYYGSVSGPSTTAGWTVESNQSFAYLGISVSTAGDVNGDGYDDVIAGASYYDNGQTDEGKVFAWYGGPGGLGANGAPTNADWSTESNQANAYLGMSVSAAGDVNGDGYDDVIIGAHGYDNGQTDEGRAFVYHGSASGLNTTADWTAESDQASAYLGRWVAAAGDVDRDGYADVLVGAYAYDNGQTDEGKTFAWYGGAGGLGSSGTPANADWSAEGNQAGARFGLAAGAAGDVNHDQYDDVVIGADRYDNGHYDEGKAFAYLSTGAPPPTVRKYYYLNGQRIAMRLNGVLYYLVGDHLGTTSLVLNTQGNLISEARHYPYGEERWHTSTLPTDYRFTGQAYDSYIKLYAMSARQYDPQLGRWISPDTIIPDPANPQSLNRYSYVRNNPLRYVDPTGHTEAGECDQDNYGCAGDPPTPAPPPVLPDWLIKLLSDPEFLKWLTTQVDNWLWDNVPSVIGTQLGVGGSFGVVIEGELYPVDLAGVFNWRSGEFSILASPGANAYFGTPRWLSGSLYGGVVMVQGVSENRYLQGFGQYKGISGSAEACAGLGLSVTVGRAITSGDTNQDGQVNMSDSYVDFIDPGSGRGIVTTQFNVVGSVNGIPNGLDVGYLTGYNYTAVTTIRLPWWPFRRY